MVVICMADGSSRCGFTDDHVVAHRCRGAGAVHLIKKFAQQAEARRINELAGPEIWCKSPPMSAVGAEPSSAAANEWPIEPIAAVVGRAADGLQASILITRYSFVGENRIGAK